MDKLFHYLVNIDNNILWASLLTIFFTLEQIINKDFLIKNRALHLLHGIPLQIGYMLVNFAIAFLVVACFQWIDNSHIGLFNQIKLPYAFKVVLGVLCIDFVAYWSHRAYHTLPIFWRMHRVHHSDTNLDSASFFRFHPFDALMDNTSSLLAAMIFGLDLNIVIFFFVLYLPLFFAHHSNFVFPIWTDKIFGKIFVTPNFHKVHHHQKQEFTDSNYGNLFIFWDKLFGTYKYLPVQEIIYGLEEFDLKERQTCWFLIKSPFLNLKQINTNGLIHKK